MSNLNRLLSLVKANLKVRYRETWIGFLWVILNPIVIYLAQAVVFGGLLKTASGEYFFYLLSGLFPWFFLSQTAEMSCTYLKSNASLMRNLGLRPWLLITSLVIENYINFLTSSSLTIIFLAWIFPSVATSSFVLQFYLYSLPFLGFVFCISLVAAYSHTLFKDVKYIAHFLFTLLYFITPTFYNLKSVSQPLQSVIQFNPLYWVFSGFRFGSNSVYIGLIFIAFTAVIAKFVSRQLHNRVYLKL